MRNNEMLVHVGIQNPDSPSLSPVITPTALCQLPSTLAAGLFKAKFII
jgi:hypothetical protein